MAPVSTTLIDDRVLLQLRQLPHREPLTSAIASETAASKPPDRILGCMA